MLKRTTQRNNSSFHKKTANEDESLTFEGNMIFTEGTFGIDLTKGTNSQTWNKIKNRRHFKKAAAPVNKHSCK